MRDEDIEKMAPSAQRQLLRSTLDLRLRAANRVHLFAILCRDAGKNGEVLATVRRLAEQLNTSTTVIQDALSELEDYSYISRERSAPRRSAPTLIRILPPQN
jgi:DNA-binding MarR family transcriptional regulator